MGHNKAAGLLAVFCVHKIQSCDEKGEMFETLLDDEAADLFSLSGW